MTDSMANAPAPPGRLRCEYLVDPLGIDEPAPRLSWEVSDARRGAVQSAYRILVASGEEALAAGQADVWDSGKVEADRSIHVVYAGPALESRRRYHWQVRTWDAAGAASPWSGPAFWEMGLLGRDEWTGKWIGLDRPGGGDDSQPCAFLRREFSIPGRILRARAYVTARGLYELHLNGRRVGQDWFTPGWTDYNVRIPYQVYDVTELLGEGENAVGAVLGDGWYCGYLVWQSNRNVYGDRTGLLAQLVIETDDGRTHTVATDRDWRAATGPVLKSDIYNGETYDARLEMPGWAEAGFDDAAWSAAAEIEPTDAALVAAQHPPVRAIDQIAPVAVDEPLPGVYVFDLGQNMVGRVRLRTRGPAGTKITLRHAEMLNADGTPYLDNLRSARCTDEYVLKGDGEEVYEPRFTFHGFRYVALTGCAAAPGLEAVSGVVLHSDTPPTGRFECSDERVNRLQHNIVWGQKGNFLEVPTDCPQRDERLGWTGDAQVFIRTACFNMDVAAFFTKWLTDLTDAQSADGAFPSVAPDVLAAKGHAAWADAGVICPWTIYLCYGDTRILERHYDAMAAWIEYMRTTSTGLIRPSDGYGDWLATDAVEPGRAPTPKDLIGTAYFAWCCTLMARIARILGRVDDAKRFADLGEQVRAAFRREFVSPAGRVVGHTQTGYTLALAFDLLAEKHRPVALGHLVDLIRSAGWHLSTGFVGTPLLAPTLTRFGRSDVAYRLLLQDTYPSWLYTVGQGATTMWERWDSWTAERGFQSPGMNSFNHYAYGAIGQWLCAAVAGIELDPGAPGGERLLIAPKPGGDLTWARGELLTMYGRVESHWRIADGALTLELSIPANARASVVLPAAGAVTEGGAPLADAEGVTNVRVEDGAVHCDVAAGEYEFGMPAG